MNFKLGLDGGGTKTEFILVDASGAIAARRLAPGCSPSLTDHATIRAVLHDNLHALAAAARDRDPAATITHTLLCMAGNRQFWREQAAHLSGFGTVLTCDDSLPVLELATDGAPGLVLHSGTGSFVAARDRDQAVHYAGGLGWRFGDPGSAHDLGRRAVARTQLELQGWADRSALGQAVCATTGIHDASALSRHFYTPATPHGAVAALAPHVTAAAAAGDHAAIGIVEASVGELAALAQTVLEKLFPAGLEIKNRESKIENASVPCGLSGTILQSPLALATLARSLGHRVEFRLITAPPIEGVRRMLART
jgi:glucosamine kinase